MAGALGVCVAAFYYAINIREQTRNRRVTLTNTLMQTFTSEEGIKRYNELLSMEWVDFDDFVSKYDNTVNFDNWMKRTMVWNACEVLGHQYRTKMVDFDTVFTTCNTFVPTLWTKFKPIIEEYVRRGVNPKLMYENFEFLADEINRVMKQREPSFDGARNYLRPSPMK
jgi:hypothetical protein